MSDTLPFTLRPVVEKDLPELMSLIQGIAEHAKLTHLLQATPERLHKSFFGPHPTARCLVAVQEDQSLAGYAIFYKNYSSFLAQPGMYLEDLYVVEACRGQGIGTALFKEVARLANDEDCGRMEWLALDWNQPALDFYQRLGAEMLEDNRLHRLDRSAIDALSR